MSNFARALIVALVVLLVAVGATIARGPVGGDGRSGERRPAPHGDGPKLDLSGIVEPVNAMRWYAMAAWNAELDRQVAERAEQEREIARRSATPRTYNGGSGAAVTGTCAAMKPAGFPDSIIQRESGGDPNAVNSSSGAAGCAQIMPEHFSRACAGLDYEACWARLWDNGAGASNWSTEG